MELLVQYKVIIMRSLGALMLIIGFAVHFWLTPQKGLSENDKAIARVARMEASIKGKAQDTKVSNKKDNSKFLEKLKETQTKQMQYMTILVMVFGVGFLGYSFIPKKRK